MEKTGLAILCIAVLALMVQSPVYAQATSPRETLDQYVADLGKNPTDNALREKIIKLAQTMKPAPAVPEEARRNYVMAKALFKDAKNSEDYTDVLAKFKTALTLAPWWTEAYLDMGLAYEAAQHYAEAIDTLKLYIAANPDSEKSRKAQDEIYIIEAKKEKTAKESSPEALAARKRNEFEAWLKKLDGARFVHHFRGQKATEDHTLDVQGNKLILGTVTTWCDNAPTTWCGPAPVGQWWRAKETILNGPEFSFPPVENCHIFGVTSTPRGRISDDGYSISFEWCGAEGPADTYLRER
jgi:tetratricopeptide (TPR) repeat protein